MPSSPALSVVLAWRRRASGSAGPRGPLVWLLALGLTASACAGVASDSAATRGNDQGGSSSSGSGAGGSSGGSSNGGAFPPSTPSADAGASVDAALPPETEVKQDFALPRGGARYVYVANRGLDDVAVIDSTGLGIRTVSVGDAPSFLATVEGQDVALVLNSGSKDVNVLRTDATGATAVSRVPIVSGANRLAVAPDGRHAVAFYDSTLSAASQAGLGGSFQEVSVLSLAPGADSGVDLTVGFRPSSVVFAADGSAAFVVTEDGVSILRFATLTSPTVAPFVRFPDAGASAPPVVDVSVTPDGHYAVARREGATQIMLLDLSAPGSAVSTLELGSAVTDLDLAPSGAFALAVLRGENTYVRLAVPAGFASGAAVARRVLTGELIGSASIAPNGTTAILYTTAADPPVERLVEVNLTDDTAAPLPVPLKKGVQAVAIAADSKTAIVIHTKVPGDPADPTVDVETQIDRAFGYTLVALDTGFAKLQITSAAVTALALTPDGSRAFALVPEPRVVERINLASFVVDQFTLGSPPQGLAVLAPATRRVFVSQEHPEGRISFIDWETGAVDSVTGFELNGRIVQ